MVRAGGLMMPVAARSIDHDGWSQGRYLAWLQDQPEGLHFEFDGARPVAMAPATVGHNRIGRNIRDAIRHKLRAGAPCDVYGPQDAIETVGGALREPDAFIACSRPPQKRRGRTSPRGGRRGAIARTREPATNRAGEGG